jgi:hypothetical protein
MDTGNKHAVTSIGMFMRQRLGVRGPLHQIEVGARLVGIPEQLCIRTRSICASHQKWQGI